MKRKPLSRLHFFLVMLVVLTGLILTGQANAAKEMPHFSLKSALDGKKVDSDQFEGKVLLITFFATWCPPCMQEIPSLIDLQNDLQDKGFSVIAISMDQGGSKTVKKVIDKTGINYPVLMADSDVTRDFGGIIGIPTSFLINQKGHVIKNYPGYVPHTVLVKDIETLIP